MTMRKLMIPAASLAGLVAIGYGALTLDPSQSHAQGVPAVRPAAQPHDRTHRDGDAGTNDADRMREPRECDPSAGIDRDCHYL
jgi:hypothetical protein